VGYANGEQGVPGGWTNGEDLREGRICPTEEVLEQIRRKQWNTALTNSASHAGDALQSLKALPHRSAATLEDPALRHLLYGTKPHIDRVIYSVDNQQQTVTP
jgi:hypothetical protein